MSETTQDPAELKAQADRWNAAVVEEFRAGGGRVGGRFEGAPMILVHHVGRRSGAERVSPMVYQDVDGAYAVFASKGGAPTHPDWYHNLVARPETTVEVGTETFPVRVRELTGEERSRVWEEQKTRMPGFAQYEVTAAPRQIPVLLLERVR
ncbi:nitroreductase family deazaflavin-dependent oxidoreductase [Kineococcus gypseus]|uniref:nitroreductase family deazaflavin-dependent oxidoreductase n=1 Tax=Kineococcus gypseus TaxID=1637102 RepID=UPI003D7EF6E3